MNSIIVSSTLLAAALSLSALATADERPHPEHPAPERVAPEHVPPPVRAAPPRFAPHPPGVHPHGAPFHAHATRVLAPTVVREGAHRWAHWDHPDFPRPVYYWDWSAVHEVSCSAEDSYGDQYPVSEPVQGGFQLTSMSEVEDDAIDRCYSESGQDTTCYLATCSHY